MRRNNWTRICSVALIMLAAMSICTRAAASSYEVIHTFTWAHGPSGTLIFDAAGNLYGTAQSGGSSATCSGGCGVVFKLTPNSSGTWTESVLYSFTGGADGANPYAELIMDTAGNLYGTAVFGGVASGSYGGGVVFKVDTTGHETVLYTFGKNALWPFAGLIEDAAGNLYGTTSFGGGEGYCDNYFGCGTIFKLDPTGEETVLHGFAGSPDGEYPLAGLITDAEGNFYGTTEIGGNPGCYGGDGCGTVFKLDMTGTETVLYRFTGGSDGDEPNSRLVRDSAGNLYGTTSRGGMNCGFGCGTVFKLDPTGKETVLHEFVGAGALPEAPVILDAAGNLYGTTASGSNYGIVFKITP